MSRVVARNSSSGRTVLFVSHNSSAVENLCDRAVWLDRGHLVEDGSASHVVATYLRQRTRLESPVYRPRTGLDDPDVRLRELRVLDRDGAPSSAFGRDEPVVLAFEVEVLRENPRIRVGFDLASQEGVVAFSSTHVDGSVEPEALPPGRYELRAEVPGRLLNAGLYSVNARVHVDQVRWIVHEDDVLQVEVAGVPDDGLHPSQRPGLVAPVLSWARERAGAAVRSAR